MHNNYLIIHLLYFYFNVIHYLTAITSFAVTITLIYA